MDRHILQRPTPPTSSLPPLARLRDQTLVEITHALQNLRDLYWPAPPPPLPPKLSVPKRTIQRLIHDDSVPDSGYASAEEDEGDMEADIHITKYSSDNGKVDDSTNEDVDLDLLRSDTFERTFAIRWVTGFVARSDAWVYSDSIDEDELVARAQVIDEATAILSAFSGKEDETTGAVTRSFSFPSPDLESTVKVELNDAPLSSEDHTCVGLQSWASSILLAERLCATPEEFGLIKENNQRVLELGAGTGLLSIVVSKLDSIANTVVATDYHPDVLANLTANIQTNFPTSSPSPIEVHPLDWECPEYSAPLDRPFDVILAADVIYHPEHARWIKCCVERLLVYPQPGTSGDEGGVFWLVIPLRSTGRHEGMDNTVDLIFPDISAVDPSADENSWTLAILKREEAGRQGGGVGRADEGGYKLFKIGWVNNGRD